MINNCSPFTIQYFKQETEFSCGAAVARSVVATLFSLQFTESVFMTILGTDEQTGTTRHSFGKLMTTSYSFASVLRVQTGIAGTLEQLTELFTRGSLIAVNYIETVDNEGHWALFRSSSSASMCLADPYHGEHFILPLRRFLERWYSGNVDHNGVSELRPWVAFRRVDD